MLLQGVQQHGIAADCPASCAMSGINCNRVFACLREYMQTGHLGLSPCQADCQQDANSEEVPSQWQAYGTGACNVLTLCSYDITLALCSQ